MARRKLIDYLNDPMLLQSISVEEMQAWADEVPYAGLVQRLLAQKLALEGTEGVFADKANTMAIISNANPEHSIKTIEDFKQMLLSTDQGQSEIDANKASSVIPVSQVNSEVKEEMPTGHGISDQSKELLNEEIEESDTEQDPTAFSEEVVESQVEGTASEGLAFEVEEESDFTKWLSGLKSIEKDEEDTAIELKDKALASTALAELLVSQGHYTRAIEMYKLLMLKNPQKSSFFAAQIEKVEAL